MNKTTKTQAITPEQALDILKETCNANGYTGVAYFFNPTSLDTKCLMPNFEDLLPVMDLILTGAGESQNIPPISLAVKIAWDLAATEVGTFKDSPNPTAEGLTAAGDYLLNEIKSCLETVSEIYANKLSEKEK